MEDRMILRELAKKYAECALDGRSAARKETYRKHNSLQIVRPPVLIFEVPWGEYAKEEELLCQCADPACRGMETGLRRTLFQFRHFEGDYALHSYYRVPIALRDTGDGLQVTEELRKSDSGTDICSHAYEDIIPDAETFLKKIKEPVITVDTEETAKRMQFAEEIFQGIMPCRKTGVGLYLASWDDIPRLHGVENCLMDLYDDPEYAHLLVSKYTDNHISRMKQYEALNVLDGDPMYLHCTPAATYDLPEKFCDTERVLLKDVWARAMAQLFAVVSPDMHEEFDLVYTQKMFDLCGLSYYGCCEPLHAKVDKLRRFRNLRRISITAWADVDVAAEKIGKDYVLSYKPNPAYVASAVFDPEPVEKEIRKVLEACRRNGTPCEFVLKDISTTSGNYRNLSQWLETANRVIDEYFGPDK